MSPKDREELKHVCWFVLGTGGAYVCLTILMTLVVKPFVIRPWEMKMKASRHVVSASAGAKEYLREYGAVPSGDNSRVFATLEGENPRKLVFFEAEPLDHNAKGELIDPWGTPYRFDLSDPTKPRFWSCGKDRRDDGGAEGSDDIPSWR
jgi:hypothetical protein